jgi:hypothetical protein
MLLLSGACVCVCVCVCACVCMCVCVCVSRLAIHDGAAMQSAGFVDLPSDGVRYQRERLRVLCLDGRLNNDYRAAGGARADGAAWTPDLPTDARVR